MQGKLCRSAYQFENCMNAGTNDGIAYSPAAERNGQPILDCLQQFLPKQGTVLEIGSGTGQHAVFFARHLMALRWQPSDRQENIAGLKTQFLHEGNVRILSPLQLNVLSDDWPAEIFSAAYSANTAHIMSWQAVEAMFAGVSATLTTGGKFCLYGPFNIDGCFTSESNASFDRQLTANKPEMGIRDMADVESLANACHMYLDRKIQMPANNFMLVFVKE
jgi:cyclopropane fatty-acyl-phospholipid synthase-like methyltransferase